MGLASGPMKSPSMNGTNGKPPCCVPKGEPTLGGQAAPVPGCSMISSKRGEAGSGGTDTDGSGLAAGQLLRPPVPGKHCRARANPSAA